MKEILTNTEKKMDKSIAALDREFKSVRAGRANPSVLDRITVDYYGTPTPINQMAAISVPEGRILQIQPWDVSTLREIEKAINTSDIGINPQNDGKVIRLMFPPLTEERRRDLVKDVRKMGEESKVAIRSIRRDALEKAKAKKKNNEIIDVVGGTKIKVINRQNCPCTAACVNSAKYPLRLMPCTEKSTSPMKTAAMVITIYNIRFGIPHRPNLRSNLSSQLIRFPRNLFQLCPANTF